MDLTVCLNVKWLSHILFKVEVLLLDASLCQNFFVLGRVLYFLKQKAARTYFPFRSVVYVFFFITNFWKEIRFFICDGTYFTYAISYLKGFCWYPVMKIFYKYTGITAIVPKGEKSLLIKQNILQTVLCDTYRSDKNVQIYSNKQYSCMREPLYVDSLIPDKSHRQLIYQVALWAWSEWVCNIHCVYIARLGACI